MCAYGGIFNLKSNAPFESVFDVPAFYLDIVVSGTEKST
jgi:hypothetical protein